MGKATPVTVFGKTYPSRMQACLEYGQNPSKIDHRLRSGMTLEEALMAKDRRQGKKKHPLYSHWNGMRSRCYSMSEAGKRYRGRIKMCKRWEENFWAFVEDMHEGYAPGLSLDRIDNEGDYSPENCRWATRKQQQRNMRSNVIVECFGKKRTLIEWSEITGIRAETIGHRIKIGIPPADALTIPPNKINSGQKSA